MRNAHGKNIYVYDFIIFSASIRNIRISKQINGALPLCELFPLIYLRNSNIAPIAFKNYKIIYIYIFCLSERGLFFYIRFSF